jgi:pseudouridine-5'-phosphate glycosidase
MPYPANVETALMLEDTVRKNGAIPATIAIIDGKIRIGLSAEEIEFFGKSKDVKKASRRDLPINLALKENAATTVAATMICAAVAGIKFFATGGIGGVHRGVEETMDISADLDEFSRTQVLVVSAGAKSILDIPRTMEYLETAGVPVIGYQTDVYPAFYYRDSGLPVVRRVDTPEEAAEIFNMNILLGYPGGMLIGNPVPEEFEFEKVKIEACITDALKEAKKLGITGSKVTPYLLGKLNEITQGKSLETNIALVKNNAKVCALIANRFCLKNEKKKIGYI